MGKTTCAAAIALEGARLGRRSCVVTIDPAKRLADALGLEVLTNEPHRVDLKGDAGSGELWALMLDTKTTFDDVVRRNAGSDDQAKAILENRLYRNISGALGGTQEYMAMEKLYELHSGGRFDLIVVDTPPTRHALEFLDAPDRLLRFLNNRLFRLLMLPTRAGLRAIGMASQVMLRTISRVVGGAVVADAMAFFSAFEGMEQGFRDRATRVRGVAGRSGDGVRGDRRPPPRRGGRGDLLRRSPARILRPGGSARDQPDVSVLRPGPGRVGSRIADDAEAAALVTNLRDLDKVANREEQHVAALAERLPGAPIVRVPFLSDDIHDLQGLETVGRWLFDPAPGKRPPRSLPEVP